MGQRVGDAGGAVTTPTVIATAAPAGIGLVATARPSESNDRQMVLPIWPAADEFRAWLKRSRYPTGWRRRDRLPSYRPHGGRDPRMPRCEAAWRVRCWWIRNVWPAPGGAVDRLIVSAFYRVAVGVVRLRAWAS